MKKVTGKQILLPGLLLAVAAMGTLFFLQIRWMNNSIWAENMRYRTKALSSVNQVVRFTLDKLDLALLSGENPQESLKEWQMDSSHPDLIKGFFLFEKTDSRRSRIDEYLQKKDILYLVNDEDTTVVYILSGEMLYEELLLEQLNEYAGDYTYTLSYREELIPFKKREEYDWKRMPHDSSFQFFLPRILDENDKRGMENLLYPYPMGEMINKKDFEGDTKDEIQDMDRSYLFPHLTINLNDSRGSENFARRLKWFNIGLISSLSLILLGTYSLLFRLYREEEKQRKAGQTFVASVSHELRTPLAVIKSASENLARGVVVGEDRMRSYGSVIGKEAERLNRMVESILYYSRLEGGEGKIQSLLEQIDPRTFTKEILSSLSMTHSGHILEKELDGAPELVNLDREAYRQIVENLVSNALLHGDSSPVRVRLESDFPSHWRLVVEDEGPGIPRKEQKSIFEPFSRGKRSLENQIGGSGLGLHLVRTAARGMGGEIRLESPYEFPAGIEKKGCRFQLILPIHRESDS